VAQKILKLHGYFDVIGRVSVHTHHCFFDVVDTESSEVTLYTNNREFKNATDIDMIRYRPKPVVGFLKTNEKTYPDVKIEFVKANEVNSSFGDVVADVCYTDNGGKYIAFIQDGLYNIDIYINNKRQTKRNIKIDRGLKFQYYKIVHGLILEKYKDVVRYYGTDYKMVFGQLIDNKGTPIEKAEMIILNSDGVLDTYIKTDEDGKFSFAIKNGEYTVKIRAKDSPVKTKKVILDDMHGFTEQLISNSILWNKQQMLKM